eukprot:gene43574-67270_t
MGPSRVRPCGWLQKASTGGLLKAAHKWNERWFELRGSTLYYYGSQYRGKIDIRQCRYEADHHYKEKGFKLRVSGEKREWRLCAHSREDARAWCALIDDAKEVGRDGQAFGNQ